MHELAKRIAPRHPDADALKALCVRARRTHADRQASDKEAGNSPFMQANKRGALDLGWLEIAVLVASLVLIASFAWQIIPRSKDGQMDTTGNPVPRTVANDGDDKKKKKKKGEAPKPIPPRTPDSESKKKTVEGPLNSLVEFEFNGTPLREVLRFLASRLKKKMILDPAAAREGADRIPVTISVRNMRLENALKWVMRLTRLEYRFRGDEVFVSKRSHFTAKVHLEVYDVRDIAGTVTGKMGHGGARLAGPDLAQLIQERLLAADFSHPAASIVEKDARLLITQRSEVHAKIKEIISIFREAVREIAADRSRSWKAFRFETKRKVVAARERKACEKALLMKTDVKAARMAPDETVALLQTLGKKAGVTVVMDPRVREVGLGHVRLPKLADVTLKAALDRIVAAIDCGYVIHNQAIYIGKKTVVSPLELELRLYHLYGVGSGPGVSLQSVAQSIHQQVRPHSWDPNMGTSMEERGGMLVIMQTPRVHAFVDKHLKSIQPKPHLLRPLTEAEKKRANQWIEKLDDQNFTEREDATRQLLDMGPRVWSYLKSREAAFRENQEEHIEQFTRLRTIARKLWMRMLVDSFKKRPK